MFIASKIMSPSESLVLGSYQDVFPEYYNKIRHPTCYNFRDGSFKILEKFLSRYPLKNGLVYDIGAGSSVVAEILEKTNKSLENLKLLDSSPGMLCHSNRYKDLGAELVVSYADSIPSENNSISLIAASLGDPFNERNFWKEVARTLKPGGKCFFTTPSFAWANLFRKSNSCEEIDKAFSEMDESEGLNSVEVETARKKAEKQLRKIKKNYPEYINKLSDFDFIVEIFDAKV